MRRLNVIGSIAALALGAVAQAPGAGKGEPAAAPAQGASKVEPAAAAPEEPILLRTYDQDQSRDLLRCCDRDGDDRLDLFEVRCAATTLADERGIAAFRRLDADRDGYLDWPEFDKHYQDVVRGGNTLKLRLSRPLRTPPARAGASASAAPAARSPTRKVLELFDKDRDGGLSLGEREALLREFGMPPMFAATLTALDRNGNALIEEQELAPVLAQFNLGDVFTRGPAPASATKATSALTGPWTQADEDGDGVVSHPELAAALRRIDPDLARWTGQVLAGIDRNRDGRIGPEELPGPVVAPTAKAMAGAHTVR
jgi:Ca2+-binding EF-hand superfamily protein